MSTATNLGAVLSDYGTEQFVPTQVLRVDDSYQRSPNVGRARKIASAFNPELAGRLVVNIRADGAYYVVDGQHRLIAMRHIKIALAPCVVYQGWTVEREAEVYRLLNTTAKRPTHFELHRAGLREGNPEALAIEAIAREAGCQLSGQHPKGGTRAHVSAIQMLYAVHRSRFGGSDLLRRTLLMLAEAFDDMDHAFDGRMIVGLAYFLWRAEREDGFDEQHLRAVLKKTTPVDILRTAQNYRALAKVEYGSISFVLREKYNSGKRSKRIGEWTDIEWGTPGHMYDVARTEERDHS